jgi:hypothetical protein
MLMEAGYATFKVKMLTKKEITINNSHFNYFPRKQMVFQPDFILHAHYLHEYYEQQGFNNQKFTWKAT